MAGWMAWTLPTAVFFGAIALMLAGMTVWQVLSPSVARRGVLPMETTRGDRLFIGLLGSAVSVLLGSAGAWYLQTYGVTLGEDVVAKMGSSFPIQATVYADLTLSTVATAVLLGILGSVLGALLPALRASSIQPVLAMRARR